MNGNIIFIGSSLLAYFYEPLLAESVVLIMDPFMGEIRMTCFNYAPQGWALCDGSILSVSSNTALFSLLGVTFGGNGSTTFGLPDLRGRVPLSQGAGIGLQPVVMGQMAGEQTVTLTSDQMPTHSHMVTQPVTSNDALATDPTNAIPGAAGSAIYGDAGDASGSFAPAKCSPAGGNQPHDNMPPYTAVNFIIALVGIYPPRQ